MGYHLAAFSRSMTAASTDEQINAVADGHLTVTANSMFQAQTDLYVRAAYVMGTTITRARISSPSLRAVNLPQIQPITRGVVVPTLPRLCQYGDDMPKIARLDEFVLQSSNAAAGAEQHTGFLFLSYDRAEAPVGPTFTCRATSTITLVANGWANGVLTMEQQLPPGRYACIGLTGFGNDCIAARLIPVDGGPRPGCLMLDTIAGDDFQHARFGKLGKLLEFEHTALPLLEIFGEAAGAESPEVHMDLIKIR
jgi:hypothetical protein